MEVGNLDGRIRKDLHWFKIPSYRANHYYFFFFSACPSAEQALVVNCDWIIGN